MVEDRAVDKTQLEMGWTQTTLDLVGHGEHFSFYRNAVLCLFIYLFIITGCCENRLQMGKDNRSSRLQQPREHTRAV